MDIAKLLALLILVIALAGVVTVAVLMMVDIWGREPAPRKTRPAAPTRGEPTHYCRRCGPVHEDECKSAEAAFGYLEHDSAYPHWGPDDPCLKEEVER